MVFKTAMFLFFVLYHLGFLEIFMARKFGRDFWGLNFVSGIFLVLIFTPIRS